MATYAEVTVGLAEIAQRIQQNSKRLKSAEEQIAAAEADLKAMRTAYQPAVDAVNAGLLADATDRAWLVAKAQLDKLTVEFVALEAEAKSMKEALA